MRIIKLLSAIGLLVILGACASLSKSECFNADWQQIGYKDGSEAKSVTRFESHRKACSKHGVQANQASYNIGYQKGVRVYCSYDKGLKAGQSGKVAARICPQDSNYVAGHTKGIKSFCTYSRGFEESGRGKKSNQACASSANYTQGYTKGLKKYCVYDKGYSEGLSNRYYQKICPPSLEERFLQGYDLGKRVYTLQKQEKDLLDDLDAVLDKQAKNDRTIDDIKGRLTYDRALTPTQKNSLWERLETYRVIRSELDIDQREIEDELDDVRSELRSIKDLKR